MILTDASVVIVHERVPTLRLARIIVDHDAAVCGLTIAELFAGIRTAKDEMKLKSALSDFQTLPIDESHWESIGRNQSTLLGSGITVPLIDTALATIAISRDIELWAYDTHFTLIQTKLPALRLFQEPP